MPEDSIIMPDDYKDLVYRATYFYLGKIAHHIPRSISPNQITMAAFLSALVGCALLYFAKTPAAYLWWVLFNFVWYLLDALDGIHARLTSQCSEYGAFLDHFLDNISFIFLFIVFTVKFDLLSPLYMFVIFMRFTGALSVFIVQFHTGKLYLPSLSGGLELILMSGAMILSYCFPHFDLGAYVTSTAAMHWINLLSLHQGVFMKLVFLIYLIGVPVSFILMVNFARQNLSR